MLTLNKNLEKKEAEKKKIKLLKDIFFQITEEIEEIEKKKTYSLEKYFFFSSLKAELENNEIDTSLTDDLSEKKIISSTIKDLNKKIDGFDKKFNKKEKEDQEKILSILEVDEESEIEKLDTNINARTVKGAKDLEKFMIERYKDDMYEFIRVWSEIFYGYGVTPPFSNYFKDVKEGEEIWLKDSDIPSDWVFESDDEDYNHVIIGIKSLKGEYLTSVPFWNEIFTNVYKNTSEKQCKELKKVNKKARASYAPKVSLFEKVTSKYKEAVRINKKKTEKFIPKLVKSFDYDGKKTTSEDWKYLFTDKVVIGKEYFYQKNKKIIDDLFNIIIKSIRNSFKGEKNKRLKEKKTVQKLKGDIQKEKDLVKQIYKKHKFVEKILASRV